MCQACPFRRRFSDDQPTSPSIPEPIPSRCSARIATTPSCLLSAEQDSHTPASLSRTQEPYYSSDQKGWSAISIAPIQPVSPSLHFPASSSPLHMATDTLSIKHVPISHLPTSPSPYHLQPSAHRTLPVPCHARTGNSLFTGSTRYAEPPSLSPRSHMIGSPQDLCLQTLMAPERGGRRRMATVVGLMRAIADRV
ncbi:hypothetical protein BDZ85DRAFT_110985 [Elsinoe ampelina]|uniref:Uncharacterized protein n=1 Tax=Elsinoe ampelina TaxID=302913 RepID=A0A6A6GCU2_9PEZI|nr:hypothetical protein BDZ85DRAFT_110985 [Elsinoe ampelina]